MTEPADIVIRSSADDIAHAHINTIPPGFDLVTATEIVDSGATVKGVRVDAIWSQESLIHKVVARDNALYRFALEGITITHMGDVGNALTESQMAALAGTDILLALVGGPPTIELADLRTLIEVVQPRVLIPMHYRIPGPQFFMLPVTEFTGMYPAEMVTWAEGTTVEYSRDTLPAKTQIVVLKPGLFRA